jgi:hypothetical protein
MKMKEENQEEVKTLAKHQLIELIKKIFGKPIEQIIKKSKTKKFK